MSYLDIGNRIAEYFSFDKSLINHVHTKDLNQKLRDLLELASIYRSKTN